MERKNVTEMEHGICVESVLYSGRYNAREKHENLTIEINPKQCWLLAVVVTCML